MEFGRFHGALLSEQNREHFPLVVVALVQHEAEIVNMPGPVTDLAFSRAFNRERFWGAGCDMKKIFGVAVITLVFAPSVVLAQERAGDAALGALSGAVVLGPIGALAGAVVGYTAGPSIAQSWGLRRSEARHGRGSARRSGNAASDQRAPTQEVATAGPQSARVQNAMPPVQTLE